MEEKKKGGKRAAPNRRGWLLAVLVLAGLGIWGILEWRAHTAPGPGVTVSEEALTRSEPFYQYDAPGVTVRAGVDVSSYQGNVDWPAVKAAGADFAMLRVGFRGYGTGALVEDNAFAQNALAFCDVIRQAGYEPVVYMNLHWAGSMYGMEELAHLPVWLASYGPVPALDRGVTLWQYSESGVVDGIEGPVDLDLWFTKE